MLPQSRRSGTGHGVGLGFAITSQIVRTHGGKVWVESEGVKGSSFVIKLPTVHK